MEKYIIAGLGNPGAGYKKTPHNEGRNAVMYLASQYGVDKWSFDRKNQCWKASLISDEGQILFVLPESYMNRSGGPLKKLLSREGIWENWNGERVIVVHDDIDIELGKMKISIGGNPGGHKGVKNVIDELGTKDFVRIKIGVSSNKDRDTADYLLEPLNFFERRKTRKLLPRITEAVSLILREGVESAMNKFN